MLIVLADDHTLVRENLRDFLQTLAPEVVVLEAETLPEAEALTSRTSRVDLIILDLIMPGMNGLSGLRRMVTRYPDIPVVIMSGSACRDDIVGAIRLGAKGFISKTIGGKTMLNALRMILDGELYFPSSLLTDAEDSGYADSRGSQAGRFQNCQPQHLTRRQQDVLTHLVRGHTNKAIARELNLKEITIKVHLQGLFRKFGVSNRTQAVAVALQGGVKPYSFPSSTGFSDGQSKRSEKH